MCTYLDQVGSTYYFRRVVPVELQPFILTSTGKPRTEWKISLRTKDRSEAKRLIPDHVKASDALLDAAKRALAVAEKAQAPVLTVTAAQRRAERWQREQEDRDDELSEIHIGEDLEREDRIASQEVLARSIRARLTGSTADMTPEDAVIARILREGKEAHKIDREDLRNEMAKLKASQESAGDSQSAERASSIHTLPNSSIASHWTPQRNSAAVTVTGLFKAYAATGNLTPAIVTEWSKKVDRFVEFLGHDDAARVTTENIREWRNHVRDEVLPGDKRRSAQTVNSGYLSPLRSAFRHGVEEGLIARDPAKEVARVTQAKAPKIREKDFTKAEQRVILSAASKIDTSGELTYRQLVQRWVPWICAYTGARVNEITQLRAEDVQQIDGCWVIKITPEAGRVKTKELRYVPVHEHLLAQGFLSLVKKQGKGPIFYDPDKGNPDSERGQYKKAGERLAAWVRSLGITDPNIKPNHAWRHTFKTISLEVGMHERAADYMQGHASKGVGRTYGHATIKALAQQMALIPRFEVEVS